MSTAPLPFFGQRFVCAGAALCRGCSGVQTVGDNVAAWAASVKHAEGEGS